MGIAMVMILLGFALAAVIVILVIVRLDRTVRGRYADTDAASPLNSESRPAGQEL